MLITAIQPETKGRIKVCIQGEADFVLHKKEAQQFRLEEGKELSQEEYQEILKQILVPRAKKRAMHILEKMDQTERQLREKLERGMYPPEAIEEAIGYVTSFHYLDDERYCRNYIRFYQESRSRRRILRDLSGKGIDRDLLQCCMGEEYERNERDLIRDLLKKKGYCQRTITGKDRDRICRFLQQRGFLVQDIRSVVHEDYDVDYEGNT